ncbi:hypothetical protein DUI87_08300 [Hirundo rustica rustica]|uniref:AB hydrolase-1 domain-containing protein n=1 Tax=Hirundo rustica rustica TaxID=333673 RepID=A0A3M0KTU3_HIRRU|nr:hypothetical protein DUI87_08300 [Hirundo rustica rustica]
MSVSSFVPALQLSTIFLTTSSTITLAGCDSDSSILLHAWKTDTKKHSWTPRKVVGLLGVLCADHEKVQRKARPSAALNESSQAAPEVAGSDQYGHFPGQSPWPDVPHKQALQITLCKVVLTPGPVVHEEKQQQIVVSLAGSGQTDFGPQLKSMNKQLFTIVAWDPRGYGKSIPPSRDFPPGFFERDAKDAVDLMQALKFKKFSLLGWSDGGITALIAAARYPNLIHKLVVWGANASVTQEDIRIYNGIRDVSKWSEKVKKPLEELYGHKYFAETCEAWVDGISQFAENSDGNICQQLLPDIKCPTFIIHGEKDPLVPQAHAEYIHKHIKGSRSLKHNPITATVKKIDSTPAKTSTT